MDPADQNTVFEVRKYPNRRFYDVTRSRHVTLSDLYELVRSGQQIHVTDSKSGTDITNLVLTQIILEHDPPKLDLFPASLLHQAIQANQQMVRRFVEQYFAQALDAFGQSRRQFEDYLKQSGFSTLSPTAPFDWVRMLFPGMTPSAPNTPPPSTDPTIEALRQQLAAMSEELAQLRDAANNKRKATKGR